RRMIGSPRIDLSYKPRRDYHEVVSVSFLHQPLYDGLAGSVENTPSVREA
ncbi:unnamed protein product, partial [marine sediment metagenome]